MINPKEKPCKGTGKAKGYGCGKMTAHRIYGLGKMCCYGDWLFNSVEGRKKLEAAKLIAAKPRLELEKFKKERNQSKSLAILLKSVRKVCHEYIRLRDKGKPCISCGTPWNQEFQAGHFYKAETFSSIKFHENNIHGQCPQCNIYKNGNESQYRVNLPERIGSEQFEHLEGLAALDKKLNHKWDREALNAIREYYKKKIKELKQ